MFIGLLVTHATCNESIALGTAVSLASVVYFACTELLTVDGVVAPGFVLRRQAATRRCACDEKCCRARLRMRRQAAAGCVVRVGRCQAAAHHEFIVYAWLEKQMCG